MNGLPWLAAALAAAFAMVLAWQPANALPQVVKGNDVLSVAFGGAKDAISVAMVHKADSYFHGGVDMDCTLDREEGEHVHGETAEPAAACRSDGHKSDGIPDPFRWVNARVRAPEVERHLAGERAVELMPWLWASVRANPHNAEAWTTAMYIAERVVKDDALAGRIAAEAREKNPESPEIALAEGKFLYKMGKGDVGGARVAFTRAAAILLKRCNDDEKELNEDDARLLRMVRNYLRHIDGIPSILAP